MTCKICTYNHCRDIDRLLLGGATPAALSRKYRFTTAELQRHQEHLHHKIALAQKRFHVNLSLGMVAKLNTVMEMVLGVVRGASNSLDTKLLLQGSREFGRIISLMHKMAARLELDPEFLYCLPASPEWDLQEGALLPNAFRALSQTRQTLKVNLAEPCPEPGPEPATGAVTKLAAHRQKRRDDHTPSQPSAVPVPEPGHGPEPGSAKPANLRDISATKAPQKRAIDVPQETVEEIKPEKSKNYGIRKYLAEKSRQIFSTRR